MAKIVRPSIEYRIPQGRGEVLCIPPAGEAGRLLAIMASKARRVEVLGKNLSALRSELRPTVLGLARKFTESMGFSLPELPGEYLIVTGHQPLFFHPGIWVKHFLLERLATRLGVVGLNLVIDTDEVGEIAAEVPARRDHLVTVRETLVRPPADVPFEAHRPPTSEEWNGFLARIAAHLDTLGVASVKSQFDRFVALARPFELSTQGETFALGRFQTMGEFMAAVRRRAEGGGNRRYLEVPFSWICHTTQFLGFFLHLAFHAGAFARAMNAHLAAYRSRHRLRSPVNPFPDLSIGEDLVELPFWAIVQGRRKDLFVAREGDWLTLVAEKKALVSLPARPEDALETLLQSGHKIRPKALALTMFCRLFLADLFIHGVGGGRYDEVTDAVIREFWGIEPPPYLVASATLWPHLDGPNKVEEERRELQRRLLDLQHNPDRHLSSPRPEQAALIEEKWRCIRNLSEEGLTRKRRRELTRRIREINLRLGEAHREEIAAIEERLNLLKDQLVEAQAATYRGYPYFLFSPQEVEALVDRMEAVADC